jgi:dolichol kinase
VFPKPVAVLSILFLAIGDPVASTVGTLYKGRSVKIFHGKSLHGTGAGFIACMVLTWAFLRFTGMQGLDLIRLSLLGGFAGAFAEVLPLDIDDNFTVPVISGFILWIGMILVNIF